MVTNSWAYSNIFYNIMYILLKIMPPKKSDLNIKKYTENLHLHLFQTSDHGF